MRRPQILVLLVALLTLSQNDARAQPKLPMIGFMGQGTASAEGQEPLRSSSGYANSGGSRARMS
jgi:hypothetical protein